MDVFEQVSRSLAGGNIDSAFCLAIDQFRAERSYPLIFEARLMRKRHELGMPLIQTEPWKNLDPGVKAKYERATVEAAREVGTLFLEDGEIGKAWPYFRALGDRDSVRTAIDKWAETATGEILEGIIEVAYHEQVSPRRGFELILKHHGTCRAITNFSQYPVEEGRADGAQMLAENVHSELLENVKFAIRKVEGSAPTGEDLAGIVAERDWLFEGNAYYLDTSHVSSLVQMAASIDRPETLTLLLGLAEYGRRLGEMYQFPGNPPFENVFEDYGVYIRTILGMDVEEGLSHFREKIRSCDPQVAGTTPAQVLVNLLVRLDRCDEALALALDHLGDANPQFLQCPNPLQLCQLAGDYSRLAAVARERRDLLSFAAATIQVAETTSAAA